MAKRGRKPKKVVEAENNENKENTTSTGALHTGALQTDEEQPVLKEVKKRGRRSKKQPTILETINNEILNNTTGDESKIIEEIATINFTEEFSDDESSDDDSDDEDSQYLFELRTLQTTAFKSLIEALKEILVEANIEANKNGMRIIAKNEKKGILVFLQLYSKKFEYYKCNKKQLHMGISMYNFYKLVKSLNNNSTLSLFVDKNDLNRLGIVIENNERKTTTTFMLKLLDIDILEVEYGGKCKFDAVIYMSASMFQKTCRDMYNLGNKISIMVYNKTLTLSCNVDGNDDEIASQETVIAESPEYMQFLKTNKNVIQGVYSLKDIISFTKCTNISGGGAMKLYIHNQYPLVIEYDVGGLGNMKLCINPIDDKNDE